MYLLSNFIIVSHPELTILRSVKVTWPNCYHAPAPMFWSIGVLFKSYDNFMPAAYLKLEVQIRNSMPSCKKPLKKCYPLWLADQEDFSILNSNSYPEMLWKEIYVVSPVDCFSLHYLTVHCFSFHGTSHCIFYLENGFRKECLEQLFYYHTKLATKNISLSCFSSNHFKTGDKLIITSLVTKDIYACHCILLIRCHMQIYTP